MGGNHEKSSAVGGCGGAGLLRSAYIDRSTDGGCGSAAAGDHHGGAWHQAVRVWRPGDQLHHPIGRPLGVRHQYAIVGGQNTQQCGQAPWPNFHQATMTYDGRYMVIYGGLACFTRIQMVSLEKGLKEYHMQQDSVEYSTALEDVWMFDFVTNMWSEL